MSKKNEKPKSNLPILIIAGVLLAAMIVGWYLITRPQSPAVSNANKAAGCAERRPAAHAGGLADGGRRAGGVR
jgi:hypothetical protein